MQCYRSSSGTVSSLVAQTLLRLRTDTFWQAGMFRPSASGESSSPRSPNVASGSGRATRVGPPRHQMRIG
eukprot:6568445-Alexandrium_andersonii.AAC.1